jgi:ubiquinone/menaquinone biosynthesis C-methylase UbiE
MIEPFAKEFRQIIKQGAGTLDIHDRTEGKYAEEIQAYDELVEREVGRVQVHLDSLCKLLFEAGLINGTVADIGCGTGATTVAMALSEKLNFTKVVGADPNQLSLQASELRAKAHGVASSKFSFMKTNVGDALPFPDNEFDLVTCISVLEYVGEMGSRQQLVDEMIRIAKPNGKIVLMTPNPFKLRSYHTGEFFGDFRKLEGHPWSCTKAQLTTLFSPKCAVRFMGKENLQVGLEKKFGAIGSTAGAMLPEFVSGLLDWYKIVATKR